MADAKLFSQSRHRVVCVQVLIIPHPIAARGKVQELQVELQQADRKDKGYAKKKIALKKIVANMTMGNDSELGLPGASERVEIS